MDLKWAQFWENLSYTDKVSDQPIQIHELVLIRLLVGPRCSSRFWRLIWQCKSVGWYLNCLQTVFPYCSITCPINWYTNKNLWNVLLHRLTSDILILWSSGIMLFYFRIVHYGQGFIIILCKAWMGSAQMNMKQREFLKRSLWNLNNVKSELRHHHCIFCL